LTVLLAEQLGELPRRITAAAQEPQSERGSEWRRRCDLVEEEGAENGRATPACRAVPVRPVAGSKEVERRLRLDGEAAAAAAGAGWVSGERC
jgi:hypothetical protein